jgi:ammonia channel protein AmtB
VAGRACINTILSSAGGALSSMLFTYFLIKDFDLTASLNGALGGLVSITGC